MTKPHQSFSNTLQHHFKLSVLGVSTAVFMAGAAIPGVRSALADSYQDQINSLNAQNNDSRSALNGLQATAASYQDAINQFQQQISGLQASIDANTAQQNDLQTKITAAQSELDKQKAFLASNVKSMYVDGTPTTIEMLATSKDLSQFVDKQEYRSTVQRQLQTTMQKIAALQKELSAQKLKVDELLKTQQQQQAQLAAAQAEQANLLSYNESQQADYNAKISANNASIASLRAAQAAQNRRLSSGGGSIIAGDSGHGGYPAIYDNAAQDSLVDRWGMYNRECVSYTAWKVYQTFGYMPYWGGVGNANQWPGNAQRAGIPTGSTPKVNSVAVWNVGYYGHVMWVESVESDGSIWVSQYNYDYTGHYSEMHVSASMARSLTYIYFS